MPAAALAEPSAPAAATPPSRGRTGGVVLRGVSREAYRELAGAPANRRVRMSFEGDADGGALTIEPPASAARSPEVRVALENVPVETFRALRDDPRNDRLRMTYAPRQGRLLELLVTISAPHAEVSRLIGHLVLQFCLARGVDVRDTGDLTVSGEGAGSLEGDESFYVRSYEAVRGKERLDFDAGDPVPDVAVEVVVSNPLADKPALYADLGVGELWVWRDGDLAAGVLNDRGVYVPAADSPNLPGFPFALAADLLRRRADLGTAGVLRAFAAAL